jgi:hypothetical protein
MSTGVTIKFWALFYPLVQFHLYREMMDDHTYLEIIIARRRWFVRVR